MSYDNQKHAFKYQQTRRDESRVESTRNERTELTELTEQLDKMLRIDVRKQCGGGSIRQRGGNYEDDTETMYMPEIENKFDDNTIYNVDDNTFDNVDDVDEVEPVLTSNEKLKQCLYEAHVLDVQMQSLDAQIKKLTTEKTKRMQGGGEEQDLERIDVCEERKKELTRKIIENNKIIPELTEDIKDIKDKTSTVKNILRPSTEFPSPSPADIIHLASASNASDSNRALISGIVRDLSPTDDEDSFVSSNPEYSQSEGIEMEEIRILTTDDIDAMGNSGMTDEMKEKIRNHCIPDELRVDVWSKIAPPSLTLEAFKELLESIKTSPIINEHKADFDGIDGDIHRTGMLNLIHNDDMKNFEKFSGELWKAYIVHSKKTWVQWAGTLIAKIFYIETNEGNDVDVDAQYRSFGVLEKLLTNPFSSFCFDYQKHEVDPTLQAYKYLFRQIDVDIEHIDDALQIKCVQSMLCRMFSNTLDIHKFKCVIDQLLIDGDIILLKIFVDILSQVIDGTDKHDIEKQSELCKRVKVDVKNAISKYPKITQEVYDRFLKILSGDDIVLKKSAQSGTRITKKLPPLLKHKNLETCKDHLSRYNESERKEIINSLAGQYGYGYDLTSEICADISVDNIKEILKGLQKQDSSAVSATYIDKLPYVSVINPNDRSRYRTISNYRYEGAIADTIDENNKKEEMYNINNETFEWRDTSNGSSDFEKNKQLLNNLTNNSKGVMLVKLITDNGTYDRGDLVKVVRFENDMVLIAVGSDELSIPGAFVSIIPEMIPKMKAVKEPKSDEKQINILFVRHGFSCGNLVSQIAAGSKYLKYHTLYRDPPLTQVGIEESKAVGIETREKLRKGKYNIDIVASSGLLRAMQTASHMFHKEQDAPGVIKPTDRVFVLPFISELHKIPGDTPMEPSAQADFLDRYDQHANKRMFRIQTNKQDYAKSNYIQFLEWMGSNLSTMIREAGIPSDQNVITIAIVSHGGFMRNKITNTPKHKMDNNDSFMMHFKYTQSSEQLTPAKYGKFERVRDTKHDPREQFCSESCTPIHTQTNQVAKKLLDKMIACPVYKGNNVKKFEYNGGDVITLMYTDGSSVKIDLTEKRNDIITPNGRNPDGSSADGSIMVLGGGKSRQEIAVELKKEWGQASPWKKRSLIKAAIKSLSRNEPFSKAVNDDNTDLAMLATDVENATKVKESENLDTRLKQTFANIKQRLSEGKTPDCQKAVADAMEVAAKEANKIINALNDQKQANDNMKQLNDNIKRSITDQKYFESEKLKQELRQAKAELDKLKKSEWWEECKALRIREFGYEKGLETKGTELDDKLKKTHNTLEKTKDRKNEIIAHIQKLDKRKKDIVIEKEKLEKEKGVLQAELQKTKDKYSTRSQQLKQKIIELTERIDMIEPQLEDLQERINKLETERSEIEKEYEQELHYLEKLNIENERKMNTLTKRFREVNADLAQAEGDIDKGMRKEAELQKKERFLKIKSKFGELKYEEEKKELKIIIDELRSIINDLKMHIKDSDTSLDNARNNLEGQDDIIAEQADEIEQMKGTNTEIIKELNEQLDRKRSRNSRNRELYEILKEENSMLKEELQGLNQSYDELSHEASLKEQLSESKIDRITKELNQKLENIKKEHESFLKEKNKKIHLNTISISKLKSALREEKRKKLPAQKDQIQIIELENTIADLEGQNTILQATQKDLQRKITRLFEFNRENLEIAREIEEELEVTREVSRGLQEMFGTASPTEEKLMVTAKTLSDLINELNDKLKTKKEEYDELKKIIPFSNEQTEKLRRKEETIKSLEQQLKEKTGELEIVKTRLKELDAGKSDVESIQALEREIKELKKRLDKCQYTKDYTMVPLIALSQEELVKQFQRLFSMSDKKSTFEEVSREDMINAVTNIKKMLSSGKFTKIRKDIEEENSELVEKLRIARDTEDYKESRPEIYDKYTASGENLEQLMRSKPYIAMEKRITDEEKALLMNALPESMHPLFAKNIKSITKMQKIASLISRNEGTIMSVFAGTIAMGIGGLGIFSLVTDPGVIPIALGGGNKHTSRQLGGELTDDIYTDQIFQIMYNVLSAQKMSIELKPLVEIAVTSAPTPSSKIILEPILRDEHWIQTSITTDNTPPNLIAAPESPIPQKSPTVQRVEDAAHESAEALKQMSDRAQFGGNVENPENPENAENEVIEIDDEFSDEF